MKKKVYISGRISDLPREQYMTMFSIAEQMLRKKGYEPLNPTRFWLSRWYKQLTRIVGGETAYRVVLLYDLWRLMRCDLIYKLPGWRDSRGANIESCVAYHFKILPVPDSQTKNLDKLLAELIEKWNTKESKK